ncbi:MAG: hypothetical protein DMF87_26365 [Acidobacteria bacterium]|nr:MAG: hypothetical protein DMF87_26365 [Acidobacteriota bacterium]
MFLLDSLMINGISWALKTVVTAAEAEMNDDTALREQLLAAEMQREMGEITDDDFKEIVRELLQRIREIKERREGGSGPLAFGEGEVIDAGEDDRLQIEASVSGDFHEPSTAPHTTIVEDETERPGLIGTTRGQVERVIDIEPTYAETLEETALPLPTITRRRHTAKGAKNTKRTKRTRTTRTTRTSRTIRTRRR